MPPTDVQTDKSIDAPTDEKLEGNSRGIDADPLSFLSSFVRFPSPVIAPPTFLSTYTLLSFSL